MEKNFDGFYSLYLQSIDGSEKLNIYSLKVQDNKIVDSVYSPYSDNVVVSEADYKNSMDIIGENVKDFFTERLISQGTVSGCTAETISEKDFQTTKSEILNTLGISERNHQNRISSILQSKENKATLGKTDTLSKIADMKNGRSGK
jgi:hypothetical protein